MHRLFLTIERLALTTSRMNTHHLPVHYVGETEICVCVWAEGAGEAKNTAALR
jgi:hypothetical protein